MLKSVPEKRWEYFAKSLIRQKSLLDKTANGHSDVWTLSLIFVKTVLNC
jgi:hypothetical protein